ncbi:MAG: hypothetical protein COA66_04480 [Arcobacter sp.]|nr:MAG: hypothetical protein COA66_04480 [Arcobacter sp.]
MKKTLFLIISILLFYSACSFKETNTSLLKHEYLFANLPSTYKLMNKYYINNNRRLVFIPYSQNENNYQEMISTTINTVSSGLYLREYIYKLKISWFIKCKNSSLDILGQGIENTYEVAFISVFCPHSSIPNKNMSIFIKIIKGKERFYTIEKTFLYSPSAKQTIETMIYLKGVKVCDSRRNNCYKIKSKVKF